jgi:hypothetical protein
MKVSQHQKNYPVPTRCASPLPSGITPTTTTLFVTLGDFQTIISLDLERSRQIGHAYILPRATFIQADDTQSEQPHIYGLMTHVDW